MRAALGYAEDDLVCVVAVGGTAAGASLLRRVLDAVPAARRAVPGLPFLVVTGPRIDPRGLPRRRGVRVLAVVQGGLTTCMELAAARRPFVHVPLRHHFEQNVHVRHRLQRYGAGTCVEYDRACDPDALAAAMVAELARGPRGLPVETDGAQRAGALLARLV